MVPLHYSMRLTSSVTAAARPATSGTALGVAREVPLGAGAGAVVDAAAPDGDGEEAAVEGVAGGDIATGAAAGDALGVAAGDDAAGDGPDAVVTAGGGADETGTAGMTPTDGGGAPA